PRVVVADAVGTVTLWTVQPDGRLTAAKEPWKLDGEITEGPFAVQVEGQTRIGVVVNHVKLVWLDPGAEEEPWSFSRKDEAGKLIRIVGRPEVIEGLVVVADLSGSFVALDPATGEPQGKGYRFEGSAAPSAAPVAFGPGRLFAPLSDGTILLL